MKHLSVLTDPQQRRAAPPRAGRTSRSPSLRLYFLVILATALTIPTLIFGSIQANKWDRASRASYDRRLELAAYRLSSDLESFMHAQAFSIQAGARVIGALDEWTLPVAQDIIEGVYDSRFFSGVFLADERGRSIVFAPSKYPGEHAGIDYSDRAYFEAVRSQRRLVMNQAIMGRKTKTPIVTIAAPVLSPEGEWRGFVAGGVRQSNLQDIVDSFREKTDSDRIVILDERKSVLLDTSKRLQVLRKVNSLAPYNAPFTEAQMTLEDDNAKLVRMFQHRVTLPGENWFVYVMSPMSVIDSTANKARAEVNSFVFYLVVVAFAIALLGSMLVGRALQRVRSLTVSLGDPGFRAAPLESSRWTPREISDLLKSGYQSIEQLQHAFDTNETLVKRLRNNEARMLPLASAWDHIDDAIDFTSPDGTIMFSNPTAIALDERSGDSDASKIRSSIFDRADLVDDSFWAQVGADATWRRDYTERASRGAERRLSVAVSPVTNAAGELTQFVVIRRDITEAWKHEQASKRNERLAALGTMAATVAHEINNPLTYILANLEDLLDQCSDSRIPLPPDLRDNFGRALGDALDGASRVADIVKRMLTLARDETDAQNSVCEILPIVKKAEAVTRNEVRHGGSLTVFVDADMWVPIRESSMFQLLVNLIHNAAQAYDERSGRPNHIRVETSAVTKDGRELVQLIVSDQGRGMSPDVLDRIFDPFFTTKEIGQGTGLGLPVCRSIIEGGDGTLDVESTPAQGTTFTILLPRLARPVSSPPLIKIAPVFPSNSATTGGVNAPDDADKSPPRILVIDDEPAIGRVVRRILRGYDVSLADSSKRALELLRTATYDLIISDVMMPDLSGPRMWQIVSEERPELRDAWIFISGGIFEPGLEAILADSRAILVKKPLRADDLRSAVAEHLRARRARDQS